MSQRLVYVVGPSGAGKDSLLRGLRALWPAEVPAHWARRTITRPLQEGAGEQHEAVSLATFGQLLGENALAMDWQANGLRYGIRHAELAPLAKGAWVLVNGSRAYVPQLLAQWPHATVVRVQAPAPELARRLAQRGRETAPQAQARLARQVPLSLETPTVKIDNSGALADAVAALYRALLGQEPPARSPGFGDSDA